jgi:hypothetical protein
MHAIAPTTHIIGIMTEGYAQHLSAKKYRRTTEKTHMYTKAKIKTKSKIIVISARTA